MCGWPGGTELQRPRRTLAISPSTSPLRWRFTSSAVSSAIASSSRLLHSPGERRVAAQGVRQELTQPWATSPSHTPKHTHGPAASRTRPAGPGSVLSAVEYSGNQGALEAVRWFQADP